MISAISKNQSKMSFEIPTLPYEMDALEPFISRRALELHYGKHFHGYLTNLNNLISGTKLENADLETIIRVADGQIFNNAAQTWNHLFFFEALKPGFKENPEGHLAELITSSFGSYAFFKDTFLKSAASLFGSGWVWLVRNSRGQLEVTVESNAGNPLRRGNTPLLGCDLWEHAYYLDYEHRRYDYVEAFWSLINWSKVEKRYNIAR